MGDRSQEQDEVSGGESITLTPPLCSILYNRQYSTGTVSRLYAESQLDSSCCDSDGSQRRGEEREGDWLLLLLSLTRVL